MSTVRRTPIERILARVVSSGDCWLWTGALLNSGYGKITVDHRTRTVHRVAYEHLVGPIPAGLVIDHLCRNRACVNPTHLEPVTPRENVLRSPITLASINLSKMHCPQGHPYDETNTQVTVNPGGKRCVQRACRRCLAERKRDAA